MRGPRPDQGELSLPGWEGVAVVIAVGVVATGLVFLYLWQGSILSTLRSERARMVLALQELERAERDLAYQVDRAYSRDEIVVRAKALGMAPFDDKRTHYHVVGEGGNR